MTTPNTVDRQAEFIRLILAIVGALLAIVGWARFAGAQPARGGAVWHDPSPYRVTFVTVEHGVRLELLELHAFIAVLQKTRKVSGGDAANGMLMVCDLPSTRQAGWSSPRRCGSGPA
jgi:hypothetical protein